MGDKFCAGEKNLSRENGRRILRTVIHSLESAGRFVIGLAADVKILEGDALRAALSLVTMSIIFEAHLRLHGGGGRRPCA